MSHKGIGRPTLRAWVIAAGVIAVGVLSLARPAIADDDIHWFIGGHVLSRDASGKAIVINRGSADRLKRGFEVRFHPLRKRGSSKHRILDERFLLAVGTVTEVDDHQATVQLRLEAAAVRVGDYARYRIEVPETLTTTTDFRVAANDVTLTLNDKPLFTLEDVFEAPDADGKARRIQRVVDAIRATDTTGLTATVNSGRFKGRTAVDIVKNVTAEEVQLWIDYLAVYGLDWAGREMRVTTAYGQWVSRDGEHPASNVLSIRANPTWRRAQEALKRGDLDEGEELLHKVLTIHPQHSQARDYLQKLDAARSTTRRLKREPTLAALWWTQLTNWYSLGDYDRAKDAAKALHRLKHRAVDATRYLGYLAHRQEDYEHALEHFRDVERTDPSDSLKRWIRSARAHLSLQDEPDDKRPWLDLARISIEEEEYATAQDRLQEGMLTLEPGPLVPKFVDLQTKAAALQQFGLHRKWLMAAAKGHRADDARARANDLQKRAKQIGPLAPLDAALSEAADAADYIFETDLAIDLQVRRLALADKAGKLDALSDLAWMHYNRSEFEPAAQRAKEALAVDPSAEYPKHILGMIAFTTGQPAQAKTHFSAAAQDKTYPWPRLGLARVAAEEGRYADWKRHADEAHALRPGDSEMQRARALARLVLEPTASLSKEDRRVREIQALILVGAAGRAARLLSKLDDPRAAHRARATYLDSRATFIPPSERVRQLAEYQPDTTYERRRLTYLRAYAAWLTDKNPRTAIAFARAALPLGETNRVLGLISMLPNKTAGRAELFERARAGLRGEALTNEARERSRRYEPPRRFVPLLKRALRLHRSNGDIDNEVSTFANLVDALVRAGKWRDVVPMVEPILKRARDEGSPQTINTAELYAAYVQEFDSKLGARVEVSKRHAARCDAVLDLRCAAYGYMNLGARSLDVGDFDLGESASQTVVTYAEWLGDAQLKRQAWFQMADALQLAYRFESATKYGRMLVSSSQQDHDVYHEMMGRLVQGVVAMKTGKLETALGHFRATYAIASRRGDDDTRANARRFEGATLLDVGDDAEEAAKKFNEAARIYDALHDIDRALEMRLRQGRALMRRDRLDDALDRFKAIRPKLKKRGRPGAIAAVEAAMSELALAQDRKKDALGHAKAATSQAGRTGDPAARTNAYYQLARAHEALGQSNPAIDAYRAALKDLQELQSRAKDTSGVLDYGSFRNVVRDAIDLLLREGRVKEAFELLDRSRDANLKRMFDARRLRTGQKDVDDTLEALGDAETDQARARQALAKEKARPEAERDETRIARLSELVAESDRKVKQLLLRLKSKNQRLYNAFAVDPRSLVKDRKRLPEGTLVLAYYLARGSLFTFVVGRDLPEARAFKVDLQGKDVAATVREYRELLDAEDPEAEDLARQLYTWLLAPVKDEIAKAKTTLIMPSGALYVLPFHSLISSADDEPVRYVVEDARLSYVSSTTMSSLQYDEPPSARRSMAAFANPDGTLPGAREELVEIRKKAFPKADVLYGAKAKKDKVFERAGQYHVMHFATHGVLDQNPLRSHLKLATSQLTVDDIAGLDFAEKTNLIVLSACETAVTVGDEIGEGISIAEAFTTAGAPTLVATLWKVDDEATKALMTTFYKGLSKGDTDTLGALRRAQLLLLEKARRDGSDFSHPRYWAAFELIGDYR